MDTEHETTNASQRMRALRAHQRGGPEQLVYEEAPRPVPGPGEITVAVRAAAITFAELTWTETWEANGVDRTPVIPSHEFAGAVAELGAGVSDFAVGDSVLGLVPFDRDGAAAEFVVVPVEFVARKEASVSDADAAAAVLPALTAWEALIDQAQLAAGQRLLVRGGTGGVGAFLTQFGHRMGAEVTATVTSTASEDVARRLGADHVIVAGRDPEPHQGAFDVAVDAVGDDLPEWVYASVRRGGRLIVLQVPPNQELAEKYGVITGFFVVGPNRPRLEQLAELLSEGRVEVAVARTFPLSDGRAAYESGARPKPRPGKTVITVP